jgi:phosphinothricin acetyltransferase
MSQIIRAASAQDAAAIAEIYNQGIEDRLATLETTLRDAGERRAWLAARTPRTPVFVAVAGEQVLGFSSLNAYSPRECYRFVADFSIYVARAARGQGIGARLLDHLQQAARELDYHKLVLSAFLWNAAGMHLYEQAGFRIVGELREMGRLDGRWVDTVIMEKLL